MKVAVLLNIGTTQMKTEGGNSKEEGNSKKEVCGADWAAHTMCRRC